MDKYFPTLQLHLNNINLSNLNKDISVLSLLPEQPEKKQIYDMKTFSSLMDQTFLLHTS